MLTYLPSPQATCSQQGVLEEEPRIISRPKVVNTCIWAAATWFRAICKTCGAWRIPNRRRLSRLAMECLILSYRSLTRFIPTSCQHPMRKSSTIRGFSAGSDLVPKATSGRAPDQRHAVSLALSSATAQQVVILPRQSHRNP